MNRGWWLPAIDLERCDGCGLCAQQCPGQAVQMQAGMPVIARPLDCTYCGTCEEICPRRAIDLHYVISNHGEE